MFEDSPNAKYILIGIAAVAVAIVIGIVIGCMVTANSDNDFHFKCHNDTHSGVFTQKGIFIIDCDDTHATSSDGELWYEGDISINDPHTGYRAFLPAYVSKGKPLNTDNLSIDATRYHLLSNGLSIDEIDA